LSPRRPARRLPDGYTALMTGNNNAISVTIQIAALQHSHGLRLDFDRVLLRPPDRDQAAR
jgi:hypothetical protein